MVISKADVRPLVLVWGSQGGRTSVYQWVLPVGCRGRMWSGLEALPQNIDANLEVYSECLNYRDWNGLSLKPEIWVGFPQIL